MNSNNYDQHVFLFTHLIRELKVGQHYLRKITKLASIIKAVMKQRHNIPTNKIVLTYLKSGSPTKTLPIDKPLNDKQLIVV